MEDHLSHDQLEQLCSRAGSAKARALAGAHLAACAACQAQFRLAFLAARSGAPFSFRLTPASDELTHLGYDDLAAFAQGRLEVDARGRINEHLDECAPCQRRWRELLSSREENERELRLRYAPAGARSRITYALLAAVAIAVIGGALIAALVLSRSSAPVETKTIKTAGPEASPSPSPLLSLHDRGRQIGIASDGALIGLDELPAAAREAVRETLATGDLNRPAVLAALSKGRTALRSAPSRGAPVELLSPRGTAVDETRPALRWESRAGATGYQVYLTDVRRGRVMASGALRPASREWRPRRSLARGEIYSWSVGALINGVEVMTPAPGEAEARFRVINEDQLAALEAARATSQLARGVLAARFGLLAEAAASFDALRRENPQARLPRVLLERIRSWQPRSRR
jgi:hypothetical protein